MTAEGMGNWDESSLKNLETGPLGAEGGNLSEEDEAVLQLKANATLQWKKMNTFQRKGKLAFQRKKNGAHRGKK